MRSFYTTALILGLAAPALAQTDKSSRTQSYLASLDSIMGEIVALLSTVLLFDFGTGLPLIVAVLLFGGIFYSFYFGWFSIRAFRHAIDVVRGIYDDPNDPGEISHFKALTSALSATIGLGNIAGVAVAIGVDVDGVGGKARRAVGAVVGKTVWHIR